MHNNRIPEMDCTLWYSLYHGHSANFALCDLLLLRNYHLRNNYYYSLQRLYMQAVLTKSVPKKQV
jgi:hypothetical protein